MDLPDIEAVASEVHLEWMESKREMGVLSRKAEDGEELMVPFEQLSEKAKELDRRAVRTVYGAIERALNAGIPSELRLTNKDRSRVSRDLIRCWTSPLELLGRPSLCR